MDDDGELTELRQRLARLDAAVQDMPSLALSAPLNLRDFVLQKSEPTRNGANGHGPQQGMDGVNRGENLRREKDMDYVSHALAEEYGISDTATTATTVTTANAWAQRVYAPSEFSLDPPTTTALQALRSSHSLYIGHSLPQR